MCLWIQPIEGPNRNLLQTNSSAHPNSFELKWECIDFVMGISWGINCREDSNSLQFGYDINLLPMIVSSAAGVYKINVHRYELVWSISDIQFNLITSFNLQTNLKMKKKKSPMVSVLSWLIHTTVNQWIYSIIFNNEFITFHATNLNKLPKQLNRYTRYMKFK